MWTARAASVTQMTELIVLDMPSWDVSMAWLNPGTIAHPNNVWQHNEIDMCVEMKAPSLRGNAHTHRTHDDNKTTHLVSVQVPTT